MLKSMIEETNPYFFDPSLKNTCVQHYWQQIPVKSEKRKTINEIQVQSALNSTIQFSINTTGDYDIVDGVRILDIILLSDLIERVEYKTQTMHDWDNFRKNMLCLSDYFNDPVQQTLMNFPNEFNLDWLLLAIAGLKSEN